MLRLLALAALLVPATVLAQGNAPQTLAAGETARGTLSSSDPVLDDDTPYDLFVYRGTPGETVTFTMRSNDIDAYLSGGVQRGSGMAADISDDDSAGGTDAQITVTMTGGDYLVRANCISPGESGSYTLTAESSGGARPTGPADGATRIAAGETARGTLSASDLLLEDDTPYDLFVYRGSPGETVTFTMRSDDFDAFLIGGGEPGPQPAADVSDDDSAGGTDSEITVTMTGGDYLVRANCISPDGRGGYTLTARSLGGSSQTTNASGTVLRDGDTARGSLSSVDTELPDGSYIDEYTYQGSPGDQVTVTLRSGDFDAYLIVGTMGNASFTATANDDDSGGGTDAQLLATAGYDGSFVIRANSLSADETGDYTLSVARVGGGTLANAEPLSDRASGRLATSDSRLGDDSYYDLYVYRGAPNESIEITMASADFDAYLGGGTTADGAIRGTDVDDDSGGGTDARLRAQTGADGAYYVRANSLLASQTGAYTLTVRDAGSGGDDTGLTALALGAPLQGRLDASDSKLNDGSTFDAYAYTGTAGEEVVITLESDDFDAYLLLNRYFGGELEPVTNDDDGGSGTNSRIRTTLSQSGTYVIVANTFGEGGMGAYTISIARPGAVATTDNTGFPALRTGQPTSGALAAGDRTLDDDSFADVYVYRGTPGERVTATLRSNDFNAYLLVASVDDGGDLTTVGQDDNSAGGTDARLSFTIGGDGTYAVQANSFEAGETGAYTLVVERAGGTVATGPATNSRFVGKWAPATYLETTGMAAVRSEVRAGRRLETVVESLNATYPLPRNVPVSFDECGYENAYYSPRDGAVTFCYELMPYLTTALSRQVAPERLQEAVNGAYEFIMLHEAGHALTDQLDLPITGLEEDAADQFATLVLIRQGDKGAQAAVDGVLALQDDREFSDSDYADEHSLGPQRYYNVACWVYGSNPAKYSALVGEGGLPEARARRCPAEYAQLEKAFERILEAAYAE